jgi:HD-like signal output (HDOD) protein
MTISVLFVDDEPNVLEGLRRMLRDMRQEWHMGFSESGKIALEMMDQKPFDVVVSDMRMPQMDGIELLSEIKKSYPHVVRIILSGHSDKQKVLDSIRVAHQYLAKPVQAEILKATIRRVCSFKELYFEDRLKNFMLQMDTLPSLPPLYAKLKEAVENPDVSTKKIGSIISQDIGMTTKLLQLVNSAFFGIGSHVSDPSIAVQLIGLDSIHALILTVEIFVVFKEAGPASLNLEQLMSHSLAVASLAKAIVLFEGGDEKTAGDAYFSGMLHDAGKLVLAAYHAEQYREVLNRVRKEGYSWDAAERSVFGATHAQIGAYLFCLWGLPGNLVKAVSYHHSPLEGLQEKSFIQIATAVSNAIIHKMDGAFPDEKAYPYEITEYIENIGISDKLPAWENLAKDVKVMVSHE